ncbi:hypothetical protein J2Z76_003035 [Sedimentibacter acidaminivorans]|uniref:Copper amine oxidase-like N-terminal domain-containing protein n=1 Tax=Sedimentibacter acidaminivorans TaxID=913099 RepID=A0ABS4GHZ3_9FIRM|nr:stalk domain-containing protein [Sedimentibacter acidaminivorans]MBP1927162.1 hypothetical protein [Sedimentibacter acidaminivorans]
MKKTTKMSALILSMTISFSSISAFGNTTGNVTTQFNDTNEVMPISAINETIKPHSFYLSFTGTVKEIDETKDGISKIFLENKDGNQAYFILSENTYYIDDVNIEVGTELTGYYESDRPMILIYPPQYSIDIVSPVIKDENIKADKFDTDLLSRDKCLKLNISENTEILWENNTQINWIKTPTLSELETILGNRKLIAFYDVTTKSIPAQTTPNKIIVLSQQEDDSIINISVNNEKIDSPQAFINQDGVAMVPIRAIAESLGYKVTWNNDERSVKIDDEASLKIEQNIYLNFDKTQIELETAPVIVNDNTFVPLSFFKEVLNVESVNFLNNEITIN